LGGYERHLGSCLQWFGQMALGASVGAGGRCVPGRQRE
jgi:hypothetical protein